MSSAIDDMVKPLEKAVVDGVDNCFESLGRAQVAMSKSAKSAKTAELAVAVKPQKPETIEETKVILSKILKEKGMVLDKCFHGGRFDAGKSIEGAPGFCSFDVVGTCVTDKKGFLKRIIIKNNANNEVFMHNPDGSLFRYYSPTEMKALKEYKYCADQFHTILRKDRFSYIPDKEKLASYVEILDSLYKNSDKCSVVQEPIIVYRALQGRFTPEQKYALQNVGSVFDDASFLSTTKKLATAHRFKTNSGSPILEITLPKGSKYLDMDEIFNIDYSRWKEQELLLPRNSKLLIKSVDDKTGIIKAQYML